MAVELRLEVQQTSAEVSGKVSRFANSDPDYVALRSGVPGGVFHVENLEIKRDAGRFVFESGDFSFLPPVIGRTIKGIFTGNGWFHLTPRIPLEVEQLKKITGTTEIDETFRFVVLCFTDGSDGEIVSAAKRGSSPAAPPAALAAFQEFRQRA